MGAEHFCGFVEARVVEINGDIFRIPETQLLRLLRTVAAVVEDDADMRNLEAHRSVEFLDAVHKTAVALDAHRCALGAAELGAEAGAKTHAETAVAGVVEHRARQVIGEAVIGEARADAGVDGHHAVLR